MQWWAWIAVGAILLGAELAFVDAQFYLVFLGASALLVGVLSLGGVVPVLWLQWLLFALSVALSLLVFRRPLYARLRRGLPVMRHGPVGDMLVLPTGLSPGESCRLEFRGSSWGAVNDGQVPIAAGGRARIHRVDGLTLVIRSEP